MCFLYPLTCDISLVDMFLLVTNPHIITAHVVRLPRKPLMSVTIKPLLRNVVKWLGTL